MKSGPDSPGGDRFENLPLPELELPDKKGWSTEEAERTKRGPVWSATNKSTKESFLLSNRSFEQVDYYMSYKFLATLIKKIKENPDRKIVVVDIGGGVLSECMRGVLRHPFLKGKVKCFNIDPFAQGLDIGQLEKEGIDYTDLILYDEDFLECPVNQPFADVIWSYQVLDYVTDDRLALIIDKAAAILAPGGEAWLNEYWRINRISGGFGGWTIFPRPKMLDDILGGESHCLQDIANRHDVLFQGAYGETTLDGHTHLFGGSQSPFIYMAKQYDEFRFPCMDFHEAYPEIIEAIKAYT